MKNLIIILTIFSLFSCVSTESSTNRPNWIRDNYIDVKSSTYIYINDLDLHRDITSIVEGEVIETYTDHYGLEYRLYRLEKVGISNIINAEISTELTKVESLISSGKNSFKLLEKYRSYKEADTLLKNIRPLLDIYDRYNINNPYENSSLEVELARLLTKTVNSMTININISRESPEYLQSILEELVSTQGYNFSPLGVIELYADLRLNEISLDNGYLNTMWYLNIKLYESNGDLIDTIILKGRESHLDRSALEQQVFTEVYERVLLEKDKILAEF